MRSQNLRLIGELINNSYARARRAWAARDLEAYQALARGQAELGADYLTVNIDGVQGQSVRMEEMLEFLPRLVPALQEASPVPLSFDSPSVRFHEVALRHYDRARGPRPIVNSVAASRERLEDFIDLVAEFDTLVIVMASEKFVEGGSAQCLSAGDVHAATRRFAELLTGRGRRRMDQVIVDPAFPVGADTYGLVNIGLDAMKLIQEDPDLEGIHLSVGLSNFAWGTPHRIRGALECAYLTLAVKRGLTFVLANPERKPAPLDSAHPVVEHLRAALEQGRARAGETQEEAGFRQAESILEMCVDANL